MPEKMTESLFFMWRTLFAVAHADAVVSTEERHFMYKALDEQSFTEAQREILKADMEETQDIRALFNKITDQQDRSQFFHYARTLVWADGDFDGDEQKILLELQKSHFSSVDFETLEADKGMSLDEQEYQAPVRVRPLQRRDGFIKRVLKALSGT